MDFITQQTGSRVQRGEREQRVLHGEKAEENLELSLFRPRQAAVKPLQVCLTAAKSGFILNNPTS